MGALGTRGFGAILGRATLYVGWGLLAMDSYYIGACVEDCMNGGRRH